KTCKNLIHVLKSFKVATFSNLLGLTLSFFACMLVLMHVSREYGYDSTIPNRERIFRLENKRNDGVWEPNLARPQLERFIASSPYIEAAAITNNLSYLSFDFGFSATSGPDAITYLEKIERVRPDFTKVFHFDMVAGRADCLTDPNSVLISESIAQKLFGSENPIGKSGYFSEFKDLEGFSLFGSTLGTVATIGGVYRDFPENCRLQNAVYTAIPEEELMHDWNTGPYYCYVLLSDPAAASGIVEEYLETHAESLRARAIDDMRLTPLPELYFGPQLRSDSLPVGNKMRTNILFFIAILVIVIAIINYINLSVAMAPVRIKSITTQKVLGCSQHTLLINLVLESLCMSVLSFLCALILLYLVKDNSLVIGMLGHSLSFSAGSPVIIPTAVLAVVTGLVAGIYPAFYMASFPPVMALNGSFSLTGKAKVARKVLIGFQFIISIALIIGSLFVYLQNRFIENVELGFEKENILEVRISMGTALAKGRLYRELLMEHPDIKDVGFIETRFITDESRTNIGYNYRDQHYYMIWIGISYNFPELMGVEMVAGRTLLPGDEQPGNEQPVCIINETGAREIISRFPPEEIADIHELVGTTLHDHGVPVLIAGIFKDFHFQSLYKEMRPFAFWVSPPGTYRRGLPENFSYVKIAGGNPKGPIDHIRSVVNELNPGYPADIHFMDQVLDQLYHKTHQQGIMVALSCLLAVLLSLAGVFGLVIFEAQGREKEIAVRKVFGARVNEILCLFNTSFLRVLFTGFIVSAPIAWYSVNKWLQSFAYRTPLYLWVFIVALLIIALLTALTVTIQSYRAATANPATKLHR
ncbi:MAG: ABC transporter permease, partial [Tannerellaceae bacterium]|nr:ABC transporter permease [Tannerellaceae bacterium]